MQFVSNLILILQLLSALVMIGLVLVQHGKGADMGASFGSGASGSLFGATGSANFLSRSTAVCATIFFCCTLGLAYLSNHRGGAAATDTGAIQRTAPAAVMAPASGVAAIPGAAPVLPATTSASPASAAASN